MITNTSSYNKEYDIFLHEKGQFWPRLDMFKFGIQEPIRVMPGDELEIKFSKTITNHLNKDKRKCQKVRHECTDQFNHLIYNF